MILFETETRLEARVVGVTDVKARLPLISVEFTLTRTVALVPAAAVEPSSALY